LARDAKLLLELAFLEVRLPLRVERVWANTGLAAANWTPIGTVTANGSSFSARAPL